MSAICPSCGAPNGCLCGDFTCPSCGAERINHSFILPHYGCGSYVSGAPKTGRFETSKLCYVRRKVIETQAELTESQEYARKLSIKVIDLGKDIERLKARCERVEGVADLMVAYLETVCHRETGEHFAEALKKAKEVKP